MAADHLMDFQNFKSLVAGQVVKDMIRTSSYQNFIKISEWCGGIAINDFQNGDRPPSWIFKNLNF